MGVKLTFETRKVLRVFLNAPQQDHYGLEICKAAGLPSGSIYPILARLEREGWLESSWETIDPKSEGRRPRRNYRLTAVGAASATEAAVEARSLFGELPIAEGGR